MELTLPLTREALHPETGAEILDFLAFKRLKRVDPSPPWQTWEEPLTGMAFVAIPAGTFLMGATESESDILLETLGERKFARHFRHEGPRHAVSLDGFHLGRHPVTQAQWQAMGMENRSGFAKGGDYPVENCSWKEVQEFIKRLNRQTGRKAFRLPTEAEWEYACRAGSRTPFAFGESLTSQQANIHDTPGLFRNATTPVGSFAPNAFGLYDMHGNVWNWCADWFDAGWYAKPAAQHGNRPCGHWWTGKKVLRGGSWCHGSAFARSSCRDALAPHLKDTDIGFRLVRTD
ncbi:MAG: formylglycine-generating enzyme family protein [Magnetococcales bacterium]|nr:formylglycine-generating enzyme family protein [Magnetococcales bacterium]